MAVPLLALIPMASTLLGKVIDLFEGDDKRQAELAIKELGNAHVQLMGQQATNTVEAGHRSVFVAGWRPFIGWTGGIAIAYEVLMLTALKIYVVMSGSEIDITLLPTIKPVLWELVFSMLGIGGLRSFEKYKGVSK